MSTAEPIRLVLTFKSPPKGEVRSSFDTTTVREQRRGSHHKGAPARKRTRREGQGSNRRPSASCCTSLPTRTRHPFRLLPPPPSPRPPHRPPSPVPRCRRVSHRDTRGRTPHRHARAQAGEHPAKSRLIPGYPSISIPGRRTHFLGILTASQRAAARPGCALAR